MSAAWPDLELLLRGQLIATSPLAFATARATMLEALRRGAPALAQTSDSSPDIAIVDALAACVEIMGFYHDRFLTESKLGSAQLLDNLARITALIGYRPLPAVAATAIQFFEAITPGLVNAGTRVAGKLAASPAPVAFETAAGIAIAPELNRMALSPLITRSAGARRAVLTPLATSLPALDDLAKPQPVRSPLPTDDFRARTDAMVADDHGLELVPVGDSRSRAVAFDRALGRSFDRSSSVVTRTTVIRHLRSPRALGPDLVGFEVSEAPILHRPDAAAPELLTSTLEVFVLRPDDDRRDPSEWDPALGYREVFDFSASEVADQHYRTFVDDALHTWIILRRNLGAHVLLDDAALGRVYARFVPAVGAVLADAAPAVGPSDPSPAPELSGVTLGLDPSYFLTSLVVPPITGTQLAAAAVWAMVDRDLGVSRGDSILIQDGGRSWVRTLIDRDSNASLRLLRWAADPPAFTAEIGLPHAHDPVGLALDPTSAKIARLSDAATGDELPTWSEFYAQLKPLGDPVTADDLPLVPATPAGVIKRRRVIAAGTTHLLLGDASHVAVGEYFLIGQRLTRPFRAPQPFGPWRAKPGEPAFDPRTPWLDAEIVQALEVRGNMVRLATPVSQDYYRHDGRIDTGDPTQLSEVIALPGVVSVASGDQLRQELEVTTSPSFARKDKRYEAAYLVGGLDHGYTAADLRRPLLPAVPPPPPVLAVLLKTPAQRPPAPPPTAADLWSRLFVAVAGLAEEQPRANWLLGAIVRIANLRAHPADIVALEDDHRTRLDTGDLAGALARETPVTLGKPAYGKLVVEASDGAVVAVLGKPPSWQATTDTPGAGQFRIDTPVGVDLVPEPHELGRDYLTEQHGTLVIVPEPAPGAPAVDEIRVPFRWDADARAPRIDAAGFAVDHVEAIFVADASAVEVEVPDQPAAAVDWRFPAARATELGAIDGGTFVAVTDDSIVFECPFTTAGDSVELTGVPLASIADPLQGVATAWAVVPGDLEITPLAVQAHWVFRFDDAHDLPPAGAAIQLALTGTSRAIVDAHIGADGQTAEVDPGFDPRTGDLGFALDTLSVIDTLAIQAAAIRRSVIWMWRGIDPALIDLPEPRDSRFVAVLAGAPVIWRRDQVWWAPERRTLLLHTEALAGAPARPSDVVRLIQVLAPAVDRRHLSIRYDLTTNRSIVTLAMAPGWPSKELAPAPVVVATTKANTVAVHDAVAPVDIVVDAEGGVRWSLHFADDVSEAWRDVAFAVGDWSAPAERGLEEAPLWRIPASPEARGRIRSGTATLIASSETGDAVALSAMARVIGDGAGAEIELAPLGIEDAFPAAEAMSSVALALRTVRRLAGTDMALTGSTILDLGTSIGPQLPPISDVVFSDGARWRPIPVKTKLSERRYELGAAYLSVFPDGIAAQQQVRLCRATSAVAPTAIGAPPLATATALRLRLPTGTATLGHGLAGNAAVLYRSSLHGADHDGDRSSDLATRVVLDAVEPAQLDRDGLVVVLALGPDDLAAVFPVLDDPLALPWNRLALAERWPSSVAKSLQSQPLRVTLGGQLPFAIAPRDVFVLGFAQGPAITAEVGSSTADGALALLTSDPVPPTALTLHGLRTRIDRDDYSATLDLTPTAPQPPWLMSFSAEAEPASLRATLLPYARTTPADGGVQRFEFAGEATLVEIFRNAGRPLYLYSNERGELRSEFYTDADDHIATDLKTTTLNFLSPDNTSPDATIDRLVLTSSAWVARDFVKRRPIVLASTEWTASPLDPRLPPELFPELAITAFQHRHVPTGLVLQSTRFNSGNFIPAAGHATTPGDAAAILASALRVSAIGVGLDGKPLPKATRQAVTFVPLEQLSNLNPKRPELNTGLAALEGLSYDEAVDKLEGESSYRFSASFSATGACTLHFLFADRPLVETVRVRIEAQYEVTPGRSAAVGDQLYPFETPVLPFDPARQLALLAPSQLKPGALVFVRTAPDQDIPELQWTTVKDVAGSVVDVDPPLGYVATALEPMAVNALGKLIGAAALDADYYATLAKAKLVPGATLPAPLQQRVLPLADRLPLDVVSPSAMSPRLAALMPGDLVLVFDERRRQAWAARRQPPGRFDAGSTDWQHWPDYQYQAVVKRVDPDTGLVVLAAPLPDRFQIRWTFDPRNHRLVPDVADLTSLRVLPHYRAPVQGPRTLGVLGSGDSTRRFARYVSALPADIGSATIPLGLSGVAGNLDGITTGNLEVLSFDPEKAVWTRWLRYDTLARAKKDPAFTLGFRPATAGQIPLSVTFGDGITGRLLPTGTGNIYLRATRIGTAASWLARPRPVRITPIAAGGGPPTLRLLKGVAPPSSQRFRLETSAPAELTGAAGLGARQWQPAVVVVVTAPDGTTRVYREIASGDAAAGAHGYVLDTASDLPPGVVEVRLDTKEPIGGATVTAWQLPGARPWALDHAFYDPLLPPDETGVASPDLTDRPGATSLQLLSTAGLRAGSLLAVFPDAASPPDIVELAAVDPPTWSATVTAPLPRAYDLERSFLRGNVAAIVQGAVEPVTIGSSDGVTASLRLPLSNKQPLLYVVDGGEPEPDVTVQVGGQLWERVAEFTATSRASRVWRLDVEGDRAFVQFGDGKHGAIPPAGTDHITARVRVGVGASGNLPAGAIAKLVSDNLAVKSTTNLTDASGGSAGDPPGVARDKAFAHRLPSDRVVTANDCVGVAIGESGVIAAALDPTAPAGDIRLVVTMEDRRTPNLADLRAVTDRVAGAIPVTARALYHVVDPANPGRVARRPNLEIVAAEQRAVHLVVELGVAAGFEAATVFAAVRTVFAAGPGGFFAADHWDIGELLGLGAIYDALYRVPGVARARVVWMSDAPLLEGAPVPGAAPDVFDPGATGVVRCDSDPSNDPFGRLGTFRLEPAPEAP